MIFLINCDANGVKHCTVYDSLHDLTHRVEWQNILSADLKVIDEYGQLYAWDKQHKQEQGCIYGYTMIKMGQDQSLANLCNTHYFQNACAGEFSFR